MARENGGRWVAAMYDTLTLTRGEGQARVARKARVGSFVGRPAPPARGVNTCTSAPAGTVECSARKSPSTMTAARWLNESWVRPPSVTLARNAACSAPNRSRTSRSVIRSSQRTVTVRCPIHSRNGLENQNVASGIMTSSRALPSRAILGRPADEYCARRGVWFRIGEKSSGKGSRARPRPSRRSSMRSGAHCALSRSVDGSPSTERVR